MNLVSKLRTEEGERVFYDGPRRHWKSDGLVFQPNLPYVMAADQHLLKWKWPELRSVDLQARVNRDDKGDKVIVSLWAMGPDGVYIDCTANGSSLAAFDQYRLLADITDHPSQRDRGGHGKPPVVEVVYDTNFGLWRYHGSEGIKRSQMLFIQSWACSWSLPRAFLSRSWSIVLDRPSCSPTSLGN